MIRKNFKILKFKTKPILRLSRIAKSFGNRMVLKKINLQLSQGEVLGVLGPNASGKSTLFNCIMGLIKQDNGDIFINDINANDLPIHERASRFRLGYVTQTAAVFLNMSVQDNLKSIAQQHIKDKDERDKKIESLIAEFNLDHIRLQKGKVLSGGEKRRVSCAMNLVRDPQIILLDEPLSALDPISIENMKDLIFTLQRKKIAVCVSDHNFRDVMSIADRILIIGAGEVQISGTPKEISVNKYAIENYFGNTNFKI